MCLVGVISGPVVVLRLEDFTVPNNSEHSEKLSGGEFFYSKIIVMINEIQESMISLQAERSLFCTITITAKIIHTCEHL